MTTFAMNAKIVFPESNGRRAFEIRKVSEVDISLSYQSLTGTATVVLPRNVPDFEQNKISEYFRIGDPLQIYLGYDGTLLKEFDGYVKESPVGMPLRIEIENEMYKLKRKRVSLSKTNCKLKDLLKEIIGDYTIVCDETKLMGSVKFNDMTAAQCLDELQKTGIYCYFDNGTFHAMDPYSRSTAKKHSIRLERTANNSLKLKSVEDTLVIIERTQLKGKKIKIEYGDKGAGNRIKRKYSGDIAITEQQMEAEAKHLFELAKKAGVDGDITLFGTPSVKHGDSLEVTSSLRPEVNGTYYIAGVTKKYSPGGIRQTCKLEV